MPPYARLEVSERLSVWGRSRLSGIRQGSDLGATIAAVIAQSCRHRAVVGVLTLRGTGVDGHGKVGPMTVLGSGEYGIEEGGRLRKDIRQECA